MWIHFLVRDRGEDVLSTLLLEGVTIPVGCPGWDDLQ